eukprot:365226-Chlamydomonas_euryale.AAC.15
MQHKPGRGTATRCPHLPDPRLPTLAAFAAAAGGGFPGGRAGRQRVHPGSRLGGDQGGARPSDARAD